jgi:hypothetical protein
MCLLLILIRACLRRLVFVHFFAVGIKIDHQMARRPIIWLPQTGSRRVFVPA